MENFMEDELINTIVPPYLTQRTRNSEQMLHIIQNKSLEMSYLLNDNIYNDFMQKQNSGPRPNSNPYRLDTSFPSFIAEMIGKFL